MIYDSVWDAICDNKEEAADLRQRASHLYRLQQAINVRAWSEAETAHALAITLEQSRALIDGRISEFTLKELRTLSKARSA
ncbi:hypothetical protein E3G42_001523 [Mycobacteroides abscessus]|uniref:XRE family transcriptional regulator n=1 Tax=Mycobacteroides abscessus TaxID=36809 RepID=UPI00078C9EB1|nr:XRE family transcriptional regulator [Mycobacteroides abscessus]AMU55111.1 hypothetical protein A3O02_07965 [Mycobacteroides abscessus]MBE5437221.1 hypothetical protein [Mycobacteroides abscessus]MBE5452039.1 hypothetical protein [Mycobacteroides abscessus]MBE5483216.1 hypothetical protein [Mycobacteroides abscessus]MBN7446908.1 XRE family transcriptional regulator [Mycobacteroides abscessus subsp. abscessus]